MKKQVCIVCRKPLNSGIIINGKRICKCCEERLVNSDINTDFYEYYKDCIKKNIVQFMLRGEEVTCQNYHL
ncbi:sigma factor G inhibitor Gin [Clostridium sp. SYSU_GA19001]|uniref:sigma factor G inhibitor Gin n=1 Tax=Clostridium caldaquaticum TaxID=2940653 RepID=UPI002077900C|nr:sigma factor G inhibitor Gin [Clostridium caldaquaticum]MCM8709658.1 sigma factor G inhibitor Gin [Clostridium caldaquaticum]